MDQLDKQLAAHLYRLTCPASEELGEYHLQMLPAAQAEAIGNHLPTCPHCRQELVQLQSFLADLAPEISYTWRERAQIWIARQIPRVSAAQPQSAPALALRGDSDEPLMYEAGDYQLVVEIQDDPARSGRKSILGLVIGPEDVAFHAQLWQDGVRIQETTLDELGNFVFAEVPPGAYDLILSRLTAEIHLQSLTV
jgi:hypothetical protein